MGFIEVTVEGGIATAVIERPKVNAMSRALLGEMAEVFERLAADDGVRGVLLRAEGRCFSAGLDLREVTALDAETAPGFLETFDAAFGGAWRFPKPLAVAVEGHAVAGGLVLALCGDFLALPAGGCRLGLTELAVGVPFPRVAFEIVSTSLPPRGLRALVYGAGTYEPREAFDLGVGDAIADDPTAAASRWLAEVAPRPARTFELAKAAIREASWARIDARARAEHAHFVEAVTSPEALRAMAAAIAR